MGSSPGIDLLREKIRRLEAADRRVAGALPFGLAEMDVRLPGGGLALGALHEVAGAGNGALDGAAAALFTAGIMARVRGQILWCVRDQDLFAPGLAAAGLAADRVIYVEAGDEQTALACFEEGLRHGSLGGVVAEIGRLSMTHSRRLQLAAEGFGTLGVALRRWRRPERRRRFWPAHRGGNTMAGFGAALGATGGTGHRPGTLACGVAPLPGGRERGF